MTSNIPSISLIGVALLSAHLAGAQYLMSGTDRRRLKYALLHSVFSLLTAGASLFLLIKSAT